MIFSFSESNTQSDFTLVGKWKGEDQSEIGYITFDEYGYALIEMEDMTVGGKEYVQDVQKFSLEYQVNYSVDPMPIDLIFVEIGTGGQQIIPCLAKVIDQNSMTFSLSTNGIRPDKIQDGNYIILNRVEK